MTIVEFLQARYDEDERAARAVKPLVIVYVMGVEGHDETFGHARHTVSTTDGYPLRQADRAAAAHFDRHDPARVLREVEAKRLIVYEHTPRGNPEDGYGCPTCWVGAEDGYPAEHPCPTLRLMALPYDDHPDCDPSWSPA